MAGVGRCCVDVLLAVMTAGHTTEYVNSVLAKVASGDVSGGLTIDD